MFGREISGTLFPASFRPLGHRPQTQPLISCLKLINKKVFEVKLCNTTTVKYRRQIVIMMYKTDGKGNRPSGLEILYIWGARLRAKIKSPGAKKTKKVEKKGERERTEKKR